jgi:hypothetical protein
MQLEMRNGNFQQIKRLILLSLILLFLVKSDRNIDRNILILTEICKLQKVKQRNRNVCKISKRFDNFLKL